MVVRFSKHLLDRLVGPEASSLGSLEIPDMSSHHPESDHWVANHFLNTALGGGFRPPVNAYVQTLLRRVQAAYAEHDAARSATLAFLASGSQSPGGYSIALTHWEYFLAQSWQAYSVLRLLLSHLSDDDDVKLFEKGDPTVESRLNQLNNAMKHAESRIRAGQILDGAITPVWLTNGGLRSTDAMLSYEETGEVLTDLAAWADVFVDPRAAADKLAALPTSDP